MSSVQEERLQNITIQAQVYASFGFDKKRLEMVEDNKFFEHLIERLLITSMILTDHECQKQIFEDPIENLRGSRIFKS